jgi:hypothetical protein
VLAEKARESLLKTWNFIIITFPLALKAKAVLE